MTWEEIRQRKEDSIRESTGNPMDKSFESNGKIYNSFLEYANSDEYRQILDLEEKARNEYAQIAKEFFESLEDDKKLLVFFHITHCIYENYFNDKGSYRGLLYSKLGFGPESYSLGMDSGMFSVHNAIYTPDELEENFNNLVAFLKLDLSQKELRSLRNIFLYGFDSTKKLEEIHNGQQRFNFLEDPE